MLKNSPLPTAAALSLCAALAFAQEVPTGERTSAPKKRPEELKMAAVTGTERPTKPRTIAKSAPAATPAAPIPEVIATPVPKKPGFFKKLFGGGKGEANATPSPEPISSPTPAPVATPASRKTARKPVATPPAEPAEPSAAGKPGRSATPTPAPAKTTAKTTPKPKSTVAETKKPAVEPPADMDPDVQEKFRFDQAKAKAAEDPQVKSLKAKADNAATEEESRKALRAYNKAFFEKIRKVDASVSERATRLEAAILKRLNE